MNYSKLNKSQLLDLAYERGLEVNEDMTNNDIINLLNATEETEAENNAEEVEVEAPVVNKIETAPKNAGNMYLDGNELSEILKKEKTVAVYIPLDIGESEGTAQPVILNGVQFNITKGVIVNCPESIAEIVNYAIVKEKNVEVQHLLQ